jgi:hypothetical protein
MLCILLMVLGLAGCGGQTLQAPSAATSPLPTTQRILIVRSPLPPSVTYNVIGPLSVRKLSYGEAEWALQELATEAHKAGANAVMEVTVSFAPSYFGWATPHGKGTAVRILSPAVEEVARLPNLQTEWW